MKCGIQPTSERARRVRGEEREGRGRKKRRESEKKVNGDRKEEGKCISPPEPNTILPEASSKQHRRYTLFRDRCFELCDV